MNRLQRLILVTGAVLFVVVLLTAPKYIVMTKGAMSGEYIKQAIKTLPEGTSELELVKSYPLFVNFPVAVLRGVAVLGATLLLYFAAGSQKPKLKKPDSNQLSFFK